ncbi:MAG: hypothetical protein DRO11_02385 [Methanobacteriota archaeon]|nr:MAG: hypothetical protein DRO11_02385 [Euryarchaeota archaeon]
MGRAVWWEKGWYVENVGEDIGLVVLEDGSKLKLRMRRETSDEVLELLLGDVDYHSLARVMAKSGQGLSTGFLDVLVGSEGDPGDVLWVLYQLGHVAVRVEGFGGEDKAREVFYYVPEDVHREIREASVGEEHGTGRRWETIL